MKSSLTAAVIIASLSLGGCGGGRPSQDALANALTANDMTIKQAKCAADVLLNSDLSDDALQAIAEEDADYKPSKADIKAQSAAMEKVAKCRT